MADRKQGRISIYLQEPLIKRIKKAAVDKKTTSTQWITDTLTSALKKPAKAL